MLCTALQGYSAESGSSSHLRCPWNPFFLDKCRPKCVLKHAWSLVCSSSTFSIQLLRAFHRACSSLHSGSFQEGGAGALENMVLFRTIQVGCASRTPGFSRGVHKLLDHLSSIGACQFMWHLLHTRPLQWGLHELLENLNSIRLLKLCCTFGTPCLSRRGSQELWEIMVLCK